jgi:hypothetical protein
MTVPFWINRLMLAPTILVPSFTGTGDFFGLMEEFLREKKTFFYFSLVSPAQWVETNQSNICIYPTDICFSPLLALH